jgi:hypothetical protein
MEVHEVVSTKTVMTNKKIDQILKHIDTSKPYFVKDLERSACNITFWHCEQPSLVFQAVESEQ